MKKLLIGFSIIILFCAAFGYGLMGLGYIGMKILPKFLTIDLPYSNYTTNCFMNGILPFLGLCIVGLFIALFYEIGDCILYYIGKKK